MAENRIAVRYVIFGAGGVGCVIGAALHASGQAVVLIGRGAHLKAIQDNGLVVESPDGTSTYDVEAVGTPAEAEVQPGDRIVLAMKSHDTNRALTDLFATASLDISIACAQNGINNERLALRRYPNVYPILTMLPATFLEPGVVQNPNLPIRGILDVGRYPTGVDSTAISIADGLSKAGFSSRAIKDVMRWKHYKLIDNVTTAVNAFCPASEAREALSRAVRDEAQACLRAAGIEWASDVEVKRRREGFKREPIGGVSRPGNSSFQSLMRGTSLETDYFYGEILLIARLHGVDCPHHEALHRISNEMMRSGARPESVEADVILSLAGELGPTAARVT
jgi:2-dehydropantoate 2-reductase